MKVINQNGIEIANPDLTLGYLADDRILVCRHDAVVGSPEQGHYETVRVYDNGGKDVKWVVDVPAVQPSEAYDEYEDVQRYIAYTPSELDSMRIAALKEQLSNTDYKVTKCYEYSLVGIELPYDIEALHSERQALRDQINELETLTEEGDTDGNNDI